MQHLRLDLLVWSKCGREKRSSASRTLGTFLLTRLSWCYGEWSKAEMPLVSVELICIRSSMNCCDIPVFPHQPIHLYMSIYIHRGQYLSNFNIPLFPLPFPPLHEIWSPGREPLRSDGLINVEVHRGRWDPFYKERERARYMYESIESEAWGRAWHGDMYISASLLSGVSALICHERTAVVCYRSGKWKRLQTRCHTYI